MVRIASNLVGRTPFGRQPARYMPTFIFLFSYLGSFAIRASFSWTQPDKFLGLILLSFEALILQIAVAVAPPTRQFIVEKVKHLLPHRRGNDSNEHLDASC